MPISRKYLHDRVILALVSATVFLALVSALLVLLRFGGVDGGSGYIIQYRANLGISAFQTGDITSILSFAVFSVVVAVMNIALSVRIYPVKRELAVTVLALGILLLILAIIVSNALLVLR